MTLQVPLEIGFHNIESSGWAENEIRSRVAKLEKMYERLVSCRVRVDQRANNSNGTNGPIQDVTALVRAKPIVTMPA